MTHPDCDHGCTSNCRREGCNCLCGEWHDSLTQEELKEALEDEMRDLRIENVKNLLMKYSIPDGKTPYQLAAQIVDTLFVTSEHLEEIKRLATNIN